MKHTSGAATGGAPSGKQHWRRKAIGVGSAVALVLGAATAFSPASLADTQFVDGDVESSTPNLAYGAGHTSCADRGKAASAAVKVSFNGNNHFKAGTAVTLAFADDNGGTAPASEAGITAAQTGSTNVPTPWNNSSPDLTVPFTVTVPATTADGTYKLAVDATGTDEGNNAYTPNGRAHFVIHVACSGGSSGGGGGGSTNQPPTVGAISGSATVNEGDSVSYSVVASDADSTNLTYAWTVTGGNAVTVGSTSGSSVNVMFTDGPTANVVQVVVNDGDGNLVTKTLSVAQANVAPSVTFTSGATSVNEHATATHTYTYSISDPGNDTTSVAAGNADCDGRAVGNAGVGTFTCVFDDGLKPAVTTTVQAKATDSDGATGSYGTRLVTVNNVAPTVTSFTGPANAITGVPVTFTAAATDPSGADTTHGFMWSFNGGTFQSSNQFTHTFTSCGEQTLTAVARDKDQDESASRSASASAFDAQFLSPLRAGAVNLVQKGSVVPVKVSVGCAGVANTGLQPAIQLLKGDLVADADGASESVYVETATVSSADSTGVMRQADGHYIYNLAIPSTATAGTEYTVRVRPFGTTGGALAVLLKIRK